MKRVSTILLLVAFTFISRAQTISTYAGGGAGDTGLGTDAVINAAIDVVRDGN